MALILTCYNHPDRAASATCADCGAPICAACTHMLRDQPFCPADYAIMRREPAGAHLPVDVPAYQPPSSHPLELEIKQLVMDRPQSLRGRGIISSNIRYHEATARTRHRADSLARWAWLSVICALIAIISIITAYFIAIAGRWHAPISLIVFFAIAVAAITGIGLVISAVTLLLRQRSDNVREITQIGCLSMIVNGTLIGIYLFVFVTLGAYLH